MAASSEGGSVYDCPICLEKLREPKYLPCLHTFCQLCIQSFIDSSISDCAINHKTISFDCPVCRCVNSPPVQNISAKEWAKQLPKNYQLLAIMDSHKKEIVSGRGVLCDSCKQNGEQIIAKFRCKQCGNNLCKTCCKFIHNRVKAFASHAIVELGAENTKVDPKDVLGNCMVHLDKPIEVYCFDHGGLGCCFCLTTVHKECKTVLSLDEIADNDLENVAKSFIKETKHMSDLTTRTIKDTKKNIAELNHQNVEILKNLEENIEHIKQRLDSLHSEFRHSLRSSYEKETSDLTIDLKTLEDFNATLVQRQNIVSSVTEKRDRKKMFIAMEKIKQQIYDHVRNMKSKRRQMKRSLLRWTLADAVNKLKTLTKLGDFEYIVENLDIVTQIERYYIAIENVRQDTTSESGAQMINMVFSDRQIRGISTDKHCVVLKRTPNNVSKTATEIGSILSSASSAVSPRRRKENHHQRGTSSDWKHLLEENPVPDYWKFFQDGKSFLNSVRGIFTLTEKRYEVDSKTFKAICKLVEDTFKPELVGAGADARNLNHKRLRVKKVEIIENLDLINIYNIKRCEILKNSLNDKRGFPRKLEKIPRCEGIQNITSKGEIMTEKNISERLMKDIIPELNEVYLFHGTKKDYVANIISKGVDPKLGSDEGMFGRGIYCCESSTKADQYADDKDKRGTEGRMFLMRFLLGHMYLTEKPNKYKLPPCYHCRRDCCTNQSHQTYDSVVGVKQQSGGLFREFVVYEKNQCYPEYLITYTREY